jgi:hypothetical protein
MRPSKFLSNYIAAWKQKYPDWEVTIFLDRKIVLAVPCPAPDQVDDTALFWHLHHFHNLARIRGGAVSALLPKSTLRVDIIDVRHSATPPGVLC